MLRRKLKLGARGQRVTEEEGVSDILESNVRGDLLDGHLSRRLKEGRSKPRRCWEELGGNVQWV